MMVLLRPYKSGNLKTKIMNVKAIPPMTIQTMLKLLHLQDSALTKTMVEEMNAYEMS